MNDHRCGPFDCTYAKTYVACRVCHQRWDWSERYGWQPNPRLGPAKWGAK